MFNFIFAQFGMTINRSHRIAQQSKQRKIGNWKLATTTSATNCHYYYCLTPSVFARECIRMFAKLTMKRCSMVLITHIIVQIVNSWKTISYSLPHITWWSSSNRWSTFTNPSTYARRARAHTHNIEWNMRQTVEPGNEMIWWFCYCKGGRNNK